MLYCYYLRGIQTIETAGTVNYLSKSSLLQHQSYFYRNEFAMALSMECLYSEISFRLPSALAGGMRVFVVVVVCFLC